MAKLIDVFPDGRAISVAGGILRARYRHGAGRPAFLQPGETYELPIDLIGTSNVFERGHRIRVDVTSSDFPAFDRHLNTGEPFGSGVKPRIAHQTVYHNPAHASYVLLPVIPSHGRDGVKKAAIGVHRASSVCPDPARNRVAAWQMTYPHDCS